MGDVEMTDAEMIRKARGYTLIDCPTLASTLDLLRGMTDRFEARNAEIAGLRESLEQAIAADPREGVPTVWKPTMDLRWARHRSALQQRWEADCFLSEWREVPVAAE